MKKLFALLLAFALVMSLGTAALAADPDPIHEAEQTSIAENDPVHGSTTDSPADHGQGTHGDAQYASVGDRGLFNNTDRQQNADDGDSDAGPDTMFEAGHYSAETEFWLNVDKDATQGGGTRVRGRDSLGDGGLKGPVYLVDHTTTIQETLKATVPLYVCMFAYGGDGTVVVPEANRYQIENLSYYNTNAKVDKIQQYYQVFPIGDLKDQTKVSHDVPVMAAGGDWDPDKTDYTAADFKTKDGLTTEQQTAYADLFGSGSTLTLEQLEPYVEIETIIDGYGMDGDNNGEVDTNTVGLTAMEIAQGKKNVTYSIGDQITAMENEYKKAIGGYRFYIIKTGTETDPVFTLYAAAEGKCVSLPDKLETDRYFLTNKDVTEAVEIGSKTYQKNQEMPAGTFTGKKVNEPIALDVVSLKVQEPGQWSLVSAFTDPKAIKAHQFTMTVNEFDLYDVMDNDGYYDISNQPWVVPAPTPATAQEVPAAGEEGKLPLPITASIAGDGVNDDTHTNVLNVAYTIVPHPFDAPAADPTP